VGFRHRLPRASISGSRIRFSLHPKDTFEGGEASSPQMVIDVVIVVKTKSAA
jgi:hypothetical protein